MRSLLAEWAGALGAVLAALCCSGNALLVATLSALGLGFIRNDAILWPAMLLSLAVALWALWRARKTTGTRLPFALAGASAVSLAAGVIVVHGPPAMTMIYAGSAGLLTATIWNVVARRRCRERPLYASA